mmetsp:Transcript_22333/g.47602  ORF Transcript_22333/g.47602 Transcript_22333/m.47602 type:complete len:160 (+) Transcript_22333:59-538(+)
MLSLLLLVPWLLPWRYVRRCIAGIVDATAKAEAVVKRSLSLLEELDSSSSSSLSTPSSASENREDRGWLSLPQTVFQHFLFVLRVWRLFFLLFPPAFRFFMGHWLHFCWEETSIALRVPKVLLLAYCSALRTAAEPFVELLGSWLRSSWKRLERKDKMS